MGNISSLGNVVIQSTPVGVIEAFAGVNAPAGWLFCDGSAISRTQYPELFSALSTSYGSGDGSTTFNIPDMRGRIPVGKGTHSDVATLGNNDGASLANRRPKHQHTTYDPGHAHGLYGYDGVSYSAGAIGLMRNLFGSSTSGSQTTGLKVNPEGASSSTSPSDSPSYLVTNYIIKAVADLPRGGWFNQQSPPVVTQLPSNPQTGQEVYYYITSPYAGYQHQRWDGSAWTILSDSRASGAWQSWSPTITQNNASIAYTSSRGRYLINGKMVTAMFGCVMNATGTSGYTINFTLPTPAFSTVNAFSGRTGTFHYYRSSTGFRYTGILEIAGTNTAVMVSEETGGNGLGASPAFAAATNDQVAITMTYEVD
jgi:microcystin-dependent protein